MTRRDAIAGFAVGLGALLAGCGSSSSARYRVKVTVEADTAAGTRSGSGVWEISASKLTPLTSEERAGGGALRGEAIVIDLPSGPVFALLIPATSDQANGLLLPITTALSGRQPQDIEDSVNTVRQLGDGAVAAELQREYWPMLVRFGDINDPKAVELVDPDKVGVRRITLQTTSGPVTTGIEKRLGWLTDGGLTLDPTARPTVDPSFAQMIRQRDFSTRIEK